ncbi:MAG: stress response translation initiation inhibitor YciH [Gemmatimonadaceae bacterium]|nr:stress response translation initiation inhibitor YciH [Gloeobacterales cyanobacterium ES-bin-141]
MCADRIVYSTHPRPDPLCPRCGEPAERCACRTVELPPNRQTARLEHDRKRRRGKSVTVIGGLVLSEAKLTELTKLLKNRCGAGGTVKDGEIEIQGDHRDKVAQILHELGYRTKMVGG